MTAATSVALLSLDRCTSAESHPSRQNGTVVREVRPAGVAASGLVRGRYAEQVGALPAGSDRAGRVASARTADRWRGRPRSRDRSPRPRVECPGCGARPGRPAPRRTAAPAPRPTGRGRGPRARRGSAWSAGGGPLHRRPRPRSEPEPLRRWRPERDAGVQARSDVSQVAEANRCAARPSRSTTSPAGSRRRSRRRDPSARPRATRASRGSSRAGSRRRSRTPCPSG